MKEKLLSVAAMAMLRGQQSLIRLVGKRRRLPFRNDHSVNADNRDCQPLCSGNSAAESHSLDNSFVSELEERDVVDCPVCGKKISGDNVAVNDHLDICISGGGRQKRVQLTILQFVQRQDNCSDGQEKSVLENVKVASVSTFPCQDGKHLEGFVGDPNVTGSHFQRNASLCQSEHITNVGCPGVNGKEESGSFSSASKDEDLQLNCCEGVLDTFIVGRKFNQGHPCRIGMDVLLVRDPDNSKDTRAIKVVTLDSPDAQLGHLPRKLAFYLSPLLDRNALQMRGYVTGISTDIFGPVSIRLICERALKVDGEKLIALLWEKVLLSLENLSTITSNIPKYHRNFLYMMHTVLDHNAHLFDDDEKGLLDSFFSLSAEAQRLFIRLYQRKGPWFRVSSICYEDVGDISSAIDQLLGIRFIIDTHKINEELDVDRFMERLHVLTVPELKQIGHLGYLKERRKISRAKREDLLAWLAESYKSCSWSNRVSKLIDAAKNIVGRCICISDDISQLLWRLKRLFFLNGADDLNAFLLVDMGFLIYPHYKCIRTRPVFVTRSDLIAYEEALQVAQLMEEAVEGDDHDAVMISLERAQNELSQIQDMIVSEDNAFLARFTAGWVYVSVCTLGVSVLEKEHRYSQSVELLKQLLSHKYCKGRRGYWTQRLSVDLEHLGRFEESLQVAEAGVNDPFVKAGERLALQRRVVRLGKPPRRWKVPPYAEMLKRTPKMVKIQGRPLNSLTGVKSRFYGYDGQQCTVEELALQYYRNDEGGCWNGVHSESNVWRTLFGLLMWDVIFADVPDVFQTPFQSAPLDLGTDGFYTTRHHLIEARLDSILQGRALDILLETWEIQNGTICCCVDWERHSFQDLKDIAGCIGAKGLHAVCKLLAEDYSYWTAGMPDLLLWRLACNNNDLDHKNSNAEWGCQQNTNNYGEAKLVEVKGPGDSLSEQQRAWILILMHAGISAEVCKVVKQI